MSEPFRKTIRVPEQGDEERDRHPRDEPLVAIVGHERDLSPRDPSKPIGYDEKGRPLYAPRGFTVRLPW